MVKRAHTISVGDRYDSKKSGEFDIIECLGYKFKVRFVSTGYTKSCSPKEIINGCVKDPTFKSVCGAGYVGVGPYNVNFSILGKKPYKTWFSMLKRCYDKNYYLYPRYGGRGVVVSDSWLNFQNFAEWCESQPNFHKKGFVLDKDVISQGNLFYNKDSCIMIPQKLNGLFTTRVKLRGDYPVGVSKKHSGYIAECHDHFGGKLRSCILPTPEDAFEWYKLHKKGVIINVARYYYERGDINEYIYNCILKHEIVPYPK